MAVTPMPEMLHRNDVESGEWTIGECEAVRGAPYTDIIDRKMVVPQDASEKARIVQAHEMAHAKLSPAGSYSEWLKRGVATNTAMKAVEEARVNYVLGKAGFDTSLLIDGSELEAGERIAQSGDWASAVYSTVVFTCSGGLNQYITGIRRRNKEWAKVLRTLSRRVEKELANEHKSGRLTSTAPCKVTGLSPAGFYTVERISQWVDSLANPPKKEGDDGSGSSTSATTSESTEVTPAPPISEDEIKRSAPATSDGYSANWAEMSIVRSPMPRKVRGGIGKKRRASNIGTHPRRISRLLTDPEKRVFDNSKRGVGGVVLIDGSGSMHLDTSDIIRITEASSGCTVAMYSTHAGTRDGGRLFILAENGRMVESVEEERGYGNGCDGPALQWAIDKARRGEPVVWVCDGHVTGWTDDDHDTLTMECVNLVRRNKVWCARDVEQAVNILSTLKRGARPERWIPHTLRNVERKVTGASR